MASASFSDNDGRLPSNAQQVKGGSSDTSRADTPKPQSIRKGSTSLARATDRLASPPSSLPRSLHLEEVANSDGEDSDIHPARQWPSGSLDKTVAARRLKRHLVMHAGEGIGASALRANDDDDNSLNGGVAREPLGEEEDGYAGDVNDEEEDGDNEGTNANAVVADPLKLLSGDVTYGIYRWHRDNDQSSDAFSANRRRGSFSGVASDSEWDVPYSQQQMHMPGGFRRQFVHDRAVRAGRRPVTMMTENFVDFIGLYGHFAGGEYPSDDDDDDDDDVYVRGRAAHEVPADVCTPLLRHRSTISSRSIHATASSKKAFFLLLKAFVGTGVLVLPKAFSNGGLLASAIIMFFVAWYAWHCMVILGEVYLRVGGSYSELGHKLFGRWASRIITVSILFAQIGFCSAYTIFVATNVRDLWNSLTGCQYNFSPTFWVLAQLLAYIPLSWVRKIKQFAPFALAANIFIMLGLGYVLFYDVFSISAHGIADIVQYNPLRFPLLVGTAVFAYEGVTLVIPILDSMTHQEQFSKVLTIALGLCIVIFVGVGTLSYMAFGESVETVILLNLPKGPPTILVQLFYSLAIMLSVPLQLFPAVRILESGIFPRSGKGNPVIKWQKNMFRALMAMVVASVAIFGAEQLDNFIAIIGAFSCTPLSFIFPAALHYQISSGHRWTRFKDIVLAAVGTVILVYVTYIGIRSWGAAPPPIDRCAAKP